MWTVVHIGVCLGFLVLAAFWVGRKMGQRRFYQIQEDMRALELSFKNLMDDMEMVSAHNMKVLESRTEDIKELMTIADRKCLYVNDLLKEMDDTAAAMRMRNIGGALTVTSIETGSERKVQKELQTSLDSLVERVSKNTARVIELEENQTVFERDSIVDLVRLEVAKQLKAMGIENLAAVRERYLQDSQMALAAAEKAAERVVPMRQLRENFSENVMTAETAATTRPRNVKELRIATIDDGARMPAVPKKTDFETAKLPPRPPVGFPVNEVLNMYERGVTLPQIARTLNMSKSEIELILKIYGEGINMRKIV